MRSEERERWAGGNWVLAACMLLPKIFCDDAVQRRRGRKMSVQLLFYGWALAISAMVRLLP